MKRSNKSEEHGRNGHYFGPASNSPSGSCRVRDLGSGTIVITRDVSFGFSALSLELRDGSLLGLPPRNKGSAATAVHVGLSALGSLRRFRAATAWILRAAAAKAMEPAVVATTGDSDEDSETAVEPDAPVCTGFTLHLLMTRRCLGLGLSCRPPSRLI